MQGITFRISATKYWLELAADVATPEEAQTIAARFPKAVGARGISLSTQNAPGYVGYTFGRDLTGIVRVSAKIAHDGVNGGRNETGIRRVNRALAIIEKNGGSVTYATPFSNSLTREQIEEILTA